MVYFDPVQYLPNELILQTFANLPPKDLLSCSLVSRGWRERSRDERLWRDCFSREGWDMDNTKFQKHEKVAQRHGVSEATRRLGTFTATLQRRGSRKRPRDEAFSENESTKARESFSSEDGESSDGMEGVEPNFEGVLGSPMQEDFVLEPPLFSGAKDPKISWPWLYKHRRQLERNWDKGKYTMFRLPDPQHEEEGHTECVYTIQHIGDTLVSGSRDRSIRIWDLNTYRLRGKPLYGHDASVLCLQFDNRPSEDIIISGGSDNYVIVWKFSTGEIIKKLTSAHTESVLNLRFDDRYLVTCSKDKTIRIWNRREISNQDPIIPTRVVNVFANMDTLPPFTLLDTLGANLADPRHLAAVNAVQIHGDVIVSASGDRTVKAWNIHSGTVKRNYTGHAKGIACVQFDGRRVVSGSSDNTVRIFDYETTGEIACLDGHSSLVRTVQARFGDLRITSDEELHRQSRKADLEFQRALQAGEVENRGVSRRGPGRNAGSSNPNQLLSIGNKMPPGGGGSRWARIVSGSYDETVIIWKRDREGNWKPNIRLHQGMLLNNRATPQVRPTTLPQPANLNAINAQPAAPQSTQAQIQQILAHTQMALSNAVQQQQQQPGQAGSVALHHFQTMIQQNVNNAAAAAAAATRLHPAVQPSQGTAAAPPPPPPPPHASHAQAAGSQQQQHQHANAAPATTNASPAALAASAAGAAGAAGGGAPANPAHHHHHVHNHHHHHHHHHGANAAGAGHQHQHGAAHAAAGMPNGRDSNRVFKLQFDARRIIACSQNRVIVGWDFAAGDKALEWVGDWSSETA